MLVGSVERPCMVRNFIVSVIIYRELDEPRVFCEVGLGVLQGHVVILSLVGILGVTIVFEGRTL